MAVSTDVNYNAASRRLAYKLDIYFNGTSQAPLTITKDNYLVDSQTFEELGIEDGSPLTHLTPNELEFTILNLNAIFSPTNTSGPYYGKIKPGIVVKAFIKPNDENIDWDSLGEYTVMNWILSADYMRVDVTAYDNANALVSDTDIPNIRVTTSDTEAYIASLFGSSSYTLLNSLSNTPFLFPLASRRASLDEILNAKRAASCCGRDGTVQIGRLPFTDPGRTITDDDQVIEVSIPQVFIKQYDDASIEYFLPETVLGQQLLSLSNINLETGLNELNNASFSASPVKNIEHTYITAPSNLLYTLNSASALKASMEIENLGEACLANLSMYGTIIKLNKFDIIGAGRCVKSSNQFIQTITDAQAYWTYLSTYVKCPLQTIKLKIRGNPLITVGSKLTVNSAKYSLSNFVGIVASLKNVYNGGLYAELTLLNIDALGGA